MQHFMQQQMQQHPLLEQHSIQQQNMQTMPQQSPQQQQMHQLITSHQEYCHGLKSQLAKMLVEEDTERSQLLC